MLKQALIDWEQSEYVQSWENVSYCMLGSPYGQLSSLFIPDFPLAGLDNNFVRIKELRKPFSLSTFDVENQPIRLFIFIR